MSWFAPVRAYAFAPLHIYQCFVDGMGGFSSASICFSGVHFPVFLPKTVGAYRIRPDVSEEESVGEAVRG